jgi:GntR family transcriptional regulator/MocR family aminotransferase
MELLKELIEIDTQSGKPVYLQVANAFMQHIIQGTLRKGLRLPGSREMAALLQLNRMTVVAAYAELEAQGWIEMLPRKGTFIRTALPLLTPKRITDESEMVGFPETTGFSYKEKGILLNPVTEFPTPGRLYINDGFPDPRLAPVQELVSAMRSIAQKAVNRKYLMYGGNAGTGLLRETLAANLNDTRGLAITQQNILVTRGAQMGIYLAASLILRERDNVIVAAPGFQGANITFRQLGAVINYVPVDKDGIDTEAIEKKCRQKKIKIVYVMPHHHNPTTATLTPERRLHLLRLAEKYKFAILEDDYDYDFHYASRPMLPMASLDRKGNVIYIGTLTKTLAPSIRIGFMVAPEPFIKTATFLRKSIDVQGDSLLENAVASMYKEGIIARHIKKSVKIYKERRDHFCALLQQEFGDTIQFEKPDGGMSVWVNFLKHDLARIAKRTAEKGLMMRDGMDYDHGNTSYNSLRMGFASLNFNEQNKAVSILKQAAFLKK